MLLNTSRILRALIVALAAAAANQAQTVVDADHLANARKAFESGNGNAFACDIKPVPPALNYSLRLEAGYTATVPMGQFDGKEQHWAMLLRVTPEGHEPTYLVSTIDIPAKEPDDKTEIETHGAFLVGEGNYTVTAELEDKEHRACRREWRVQAKQDRSEHGLRPMLPAGAVAATSSGITPPEAPSNDRKGAVTILFDAAPVSRKAPQLEAGDLSRLTDSLSSLITELDASAVRLIAFNLEQQKIVYKSDSFTLAKLDKLRSAITEVKTGLVSAAVLANPNGSRDLLAKLLDEEAGGPEHRTVIFLGPHSRVQQSAKNGDPVSGEWANRLFYLEHKGELQHEMVMPQRRRGYGPMMDGRFGDRSPRGPVVAEFPDTIEQLVKQLKGKTFTIRTPKDYASAIVSIQHSL